MKCKLNLKSLYSLLRRIEPRRGEYDVVWDGPFFEESSRKWHPVAFVLYNWVLYGTITLGMKHSELEWNIKEKKASVPNTSSTWESEEIWKKAIPQLERKLRSALTNPEEYNQKVNSHLPFPCRSGKIERCLTWPKAFLPIPELTLCQVEKALDKSSQFIPIPKMTTDFYLKTAAIAYDAAFLKTKKLSPIEKHRRWADTRHGGMLDLPFGSAPAFARWYASKKWSGCHPWEIVFAHPHGVMLSPSKVSGGWRFYLSVDTKGLYVSVVKMALALEKHGIPFELIQNKEIIRTLRGIDEVEVGPFYEQIPLTELRSSRRDAVSKVRWDLITEILPISKEGKAKLTHVERAGSPVGLK